MHHTPVLLSETLALLSPQPGEVVLDVTLGLGGHAQALLKATDPDGRLIGLDADAVNLAEAQRRLASWEGRIALHHANFRSTLDVVDKPVDVLFADLGVSSPHFDDPSRGFTFRADAPLDLRFDQQAGSTAAEWIAAASAQEITDALREFGEVNQAYRLAQVIKKRHPLTTTELAECVEEVCTWRTSSILPQVFQALRIAVNDELGSLRTLLDAIPQLLHPGGRCGIIAYHSLEDRLVKQYFRTLCAVEKDPETGQDMGKPAYVLLTKKAIVPGAQEIAQNPRARSAKFRAVCKAG